MLGRKWLVGLTCAGLILAAGMTASGGAAQAATVGTTASVYPHDTVAGTSGMWITFTVNNTGAPVEAVRIVRPTSLFSVYSGAAQGWTATDSPAGGYVTFTGSVLPSGGSAVFNVQVGAGAPAQDQFGHWSVLTSTNNGNTYAVAQGAGNTISSLSGNIRVLAMTEPTISPSENGGSGVTEGETVIMTSVVTNEGTGTITLSDTLSRVSGDERGDIVSGGTYVGPSSLDPGQSAQVQLTGVQIGTNTGSGRHLRTTIAGTEGSATQAMVNTVTIGTPAPYVQSASTGDNGRAVTMNLSISEPVRGTEAVDNWTVTDDQGVQHPVANVTGSGSAAWVLELAPSPPFPGNSTATITYTPGNLADSNGNPLPPTTIQASVGISN